MDIKKLLTANHYDVDDIVSAVGMKREGNVIVPNETYSEEYFLKTLKEYVEGEVEFGKNPSYVLGGLFTNYEDKAIFLELLREE